MTAQKIVCEQTLQYCLIEDSLFENLQFTLLAVEGNVANMYTNSDTHIFRHTQISSPFLYQIYLINHCHVPLIANDFLTCAGCKILQFAIYFYS